MIRKGTIEDAEILSKVEATCFLPNEAANSRKIKCICESFSFIVRKKPID